MKEKPDKGNVLVSGNLLRRVYDSYAAGVAYISILNKKGDEGIGSCFHIGDGVFITAKHVVEGCTIKEIGTTVALRRFYETEDTKNTGGTLVDIPFSPKITSNYKGPFFHPDDKIDVAALIVQDIDAPILPLGDHLDDWLGDEYVLSEVVIMGYPPIPFSITPLLITSKCEVNAIVDKYTGGHPHFILSSMARGGFSGGPAITDEGIVLGVITESLIHDHEPVELGYLSVLSVEGIYGCISHHRIVPKNIDDQWNGFWNKESIDYSDSPSDHVSVSIYRGFRNFYFEVFSYRQDVIHGSLEIFDASSLGFYSLTWIHNSMIKIEFKPGSINEDLANSLYSLLIKMTEGLGVNRYGQP